MNRRILLCLGCLVLLSACSLQGMYNKVSMRRGEQAMVNRDFAAAAKAFEGPAQSSDNGREPGNPVAQYWLGTFLYHGTGVPMDRAAAVQWMSLAAASQYAPAELALGLWHIEGRGAPLDPAEGARRVARAAAKDMPEAVMVLAGLTAQGVGVPRDQAQALSLFVKAQKLGYPVPADLLTPKGVARLAANRK
jgi:TPR repeat protein